MGAGKSSTTAVAAGKIPSAILSVRGQRVIVDEDLARLYGVSTARLNEAVKRNGRRFPGDFMFRLTRSEWFNLQRLRSQIAILDANLSEQSLVTVHHHRRGRYRKYLPNVFTEHGALMAANILNSPRAVTMSVHVVRAFIRMRELLSQNHVLAEKLAELDRRLTSRLDRHEQVIIRLLADIRRLTADPTPGKRRPIGFITAKR